MSQANPLHTTVTAPVPHPLFAKRNGLGDRLRLAQVLQLQQHGQGAFQLAVQVGFIARQALEPVGVEGFGEDVRAYEGTVFQFLAAGVVPGGHVPFLVDDRERRAAYAWETPGRGPG